MGLVGLRAGPIGPLPRWKILCVIALMMACAFAAAWLFLPSTGWAGFSPWDRLTGETPGAKVAAFVRPRPGRRGGAAFLDLGSGRQ